MPVLIFVLLVVIVSAVIHKYTKTIAGPSLTSALICSILFHLIEYAVVGHFDSLVMVSIIISFLVAFFVALGIGTLMRKSGKKVVREH